MSSDISPTDGEQDDSQPTSPQPTADGDGDADGCSRRGFLRRGATAAGTVGAIGAGGSQVAPDLAPVQNAEAIPPAFIAAGGVAYGAAGVGWALRDAEVIGSDDAPTDEQAQQLINNAWETCYTRWSTNDSILTSVDSLMEFLDHAAYSSAKLAAIEALNDEQDQDTVEQFAKDALDEEESRIKRNILGTWNESVLEFYTQAEAIDDHPDLNVDDDDSDDSGHNFSTDFSERTDGYLTARGHENDWDEPPSTEIELPDGQEFETYYFELSQESSNYTPDPNTGSTHYLNFAVVADRTFTYEKDWDFDESSYLAPDGDEDLGDLFAYLRGDKWQSFWTDIEDKFDDLRNGIETYVDTVYGEVQSGEIAPEELLTVREMAETMAEEEGANQALADLIALGLPVDLERRAHIEIERDGATVDLTGILMPTSEPEYGELVADNNVIPEEKDYELFFTYNVAEHSGEFQAYDDGLDGGELTFHEEPHDNVLYHVHTNQGEDVEITADDFEPATDPYWEAEEWVTDLSDDLDDTIAEVDQIVMYAKDGDTAYQTVRLEDQFYLEKFTDEDGEEYDEATYEETETHEDDNFVSQEQFEEWQEEQEKITKEIIDDPDDDDDPLIDLPDWDDVGDAANRAIGMAITGLVLVVGIFAALNSSGN